MKKYEVIITKWSSEEMAQIQKVAGTFDTYMNAKLFAKAYSEYYSATVEIREYTISYESHSYRA